MVAVGGASGQVSVMHVGRLQHMVSVMRVNLGLDVVFGVVIRHEVHSALSLQTQKDTRGIFSIFLCYCLHTHTRTHTAGHSLPEHF